MASEKLRKMRLSRTRRIKDLQSSLETRVPPTANEAAPALPPIAAKADDFDAIKKAVEDAASVGAPLWLSYLFLLFYVALAASGVKHTDLLLENPVELPFLNIKLPLIAFFVIAPILFVIVHAYVMAHFALLSDKAKHFHTALRETICDGHNSHQARERLRKQLPINMFVQFLAGPTEIREGPFSVLLWAVAGISLVAGPVLALLLLHVQFLPYHDSRVTWVHRGALISNLVFIWWLWMKILSGRSRSDAGEHAAAGRWPRFWCRFLWWSRNIVAWPLTGLIVVFSVLVATFPGEWQQLPYSLAPALEPRATAATQAIFGKVDPLNKNEKDRITGSWPTNTLRLKEFDLYEALKVEERKKFDEKPTSYVLHHRHFEGADLRSAWLGRVDMRDAYLEGAWLDRVQLPRAALDKAHLEGASLSEAHLEGASLSEAHLEGASLKKAQLQCASLDRARLQGASLDHAGLDGASLDSAELQGASLDHAHLQGASLDTAELRGASLDWAYIQGASLDWAQLQGASLDHARLQGASLDEAFLQGASLDGAQLQGASLDGAQLQGASLKKAQLQGASLDGAEMEATNLTGAFLWRAFGAPNAEASLTQDVHWGAETSFPRIGPWTTAHYSMLRWQTEKSTPKESRITALERIAMLDCARKDLAPCEPSAKPPHRLAAELDSANDPAEYQKSLAKIVRDLVCNHGEDVIYVLRRMAIDQFPGLEAPLLVDDIIEGKRCPVSAALTKGDKTLLLEIKKKAAERGAAPEAEKLAAKEGAQQVPEPSPPRQRSQSKKKKPR